MKKIIPALLITSTLSGAVLANNSYHGTAMLAYATSDGEISGVEVEAEVTGFVGTFYLDPVSYGNHPYAEAAFLEKASSLNFGHTNSKFEAKSLGISNTNGETGIGFHLVQPESYFVFAAGYSKGDDSDSLNIRLGQYLTDYSMIMLGYDLTEPDDAEEISQFSIAYKHVAPFNGTTWAWEVEIYREDDDEFGDKDTGVSLEADYFLSRATSIGFFIETVSGDNDSKSYGFGGEHFFQPNVGIFLGFIRFDPDAQDSETDAFAISGEFRF